MTKVRNKLFSDMRNKNEKRVEKLIPRVLSEYENYDPSLSDLQDIYALALNNLPPRYMHSMTFVLKEPVSDSYILEKIREAVAKVRDNPKEVGMPVVK